MSGCTSWDPDDRVVSWNLRAKAWRVGVASAEGPREWGGVSVGGSQEGRLWLSKHPPLYLYYVFSSPGLVQRGCFPISNAQRPLSVIPPRPPRSPYSPTTTTTWQPSPPPCTPDNALLSGATLNQCLHKKPGRPLSVCTHCCAIVSSSPVFWRSPGI